MVVVVTERSCYNPGKVKTMAFKITREKVPLRMDADENFNDE